MKLVIFTLAIIATASADVIHLNNKYLPPDQVDVVPLPNNQINLELPIAVGAQQEVAASVVSQKSVVLPQVDIKIAVDPIPANLPSLAASEPAAESAPEPAAEPAPEPAPEPVLELASAPAPAAEPAPEAAAASVVVSQVEVKAAPVAAIINQRIGADEDAESSQLNIVQSAPQQLILQSAPIQQDLIVQQVPQLQLNLQQSIPQQLSVQQAVAQLDQIVVDQQQQQQIVGSGIDTQYAADGGYLY